MKLNKVTIKIIPDPDVDISHFDEEIREEIQQEYDNGLFEFVGVQAEAQILSKNNTLQYIHSAGIWGMQSNFDEGIEEAKKEQLEELNEELSEFGLSVNDVDGYETKEVNE